MGEPGKKLSGKKKKGRRAGLKTSGRKKPVPQNVATRHSRSKPGKKKNRTWW